MKSNLLRDAANFCNNFWSISPYECKNSSIVDLQNKKSFVSYLVIDENEQVTLKENHKYYMQVQLAMYVTCTKLCNFFVFSDFHHIFLRFLSKFWESCVGIGYGERLRLKQKLLAKDSFIRFTPTWAYTLCTCAHTTNTG